MFDFRHAVCADVDSRSIPLSLRRLLGLFACRLGCGGTVFSSRRAGCVAMSCLPVGSSRLSPRLSSRRSGRFLRLAPSCDTIGGASAVAVRLRRAFVPHPDFLPPVSPPVLACLGSSPPSDMDGGVGLRSVGSSCCLLAYPVVSVPFRLSSLYRSISWLVRLMRFVAVSRCCGYEFGGCHALPYIIPSSPVVFGRLRRAC